MAKISNITSEGTKYDIRATAIPFGRVDSSSTATVFTATVPGITELTDGTCVMLDNGVITSASGFTLNVNGLGAKPVYNSMAEATRDTTIFNKAYTMLFVYDETRVSGGCWVCYRGYDANTNTIGYQLRTNSGNLHMSDATARYRLYFTSADGTKWVPANTSTSTDATTARTLNTRPIDPFAPIVYNSTNATVASGARPPVATLWQQYTLTIGYSVVKSLTAWTPVYMQCTPQTDGSAVMNDIAQTLPTSADGKIYIFLGIAYSATAMELRAEHPVFYHDGTGIRIWTGKAIPTKTSELTNDSGFLTSAPVTSVNSKTGAVSLTASDVGALPSSTTIPTKTSQLTNDSGFITDAGVTSFNGSTGAVTYTAPVTSVNGQTGAVTVTEGLAPLIGTTDNILPSRVSSAIAEGRDVAISYTDGTFGNLVFTAFNKAVTLNALVANTIAFYNSTLYLFELDGALAYDMWLFTYRELAQIEDLADYVPTSRTINNKALSNNITLSASDVGALPSTTAIPTKTSDLTNDSGFITSTALGSYVPTSRTVNGKALSSNISLAVSSTASTTNTDILKSATVSGKTLVLGATTLSIT